MGKVVRALSETDRECEIVAGVDIVISFDGLTIPTYPSFSYCDMPADVVMDFTGPGALSDLLGFCLKKALPVVICSTGYTEQDKREIQSASRHIAVFYSPNMSLGIGLIVSMLGRASRLLNGSGFDIEIVERHHNQKKDAPSGTALLLADAANKALDGEMKINAGRSGRESKRDKNEIGMHSIRGGSIVGEHSVVFAGHDEVIEFKHTVLSREVFAVGALKAAAFIKGKPAGLYDMQDLMDGFE